MAVGRSLCFLFDSRKALSKRVSGVLVRHWVTCFLARRCSQASPARNTTSWAGLAPVAQEAMGQLAFLSSSGL